MSDTQTPPGPTSSPSIFKSRKTRKALGGLAQAVVALVAVIISQKFQLVSEQQATELVTQTLLFIGGLTGVDILGTAYEDGQEKKALPPPPSGIPPRS